MKLRFWLFHLFNYASLTLTLRVKVFLFPSSIRRKEMTTWNLDDFVNGEMMPNLAASTPVGISKKKENPVTTE